MSEQLNSTTNTFTILVADRNPHVRAFLGRELAAEGYEVMTAKDGRDLLRMLSSSESPHLLVLDLELPDVSGLQILMELQDRKPLLPVVIHTFRTEYADHPALKKAAAFVEKTGDHIESFKAVIGGVLQRYYSRKTDLGKPGGQAATKYGS
jgi:DNA-binding response OmpR family regulator